MYMLQVNKEARALKKSYQVGQTLVPNDCITHIRISFYSLRLAKSDVFTPRFWEYQWIVDEFIQSQDKQESIHIPTSGNNLTLLEKNFKQKEADFDSGFSDG